MSQVRVGTDNNSGIIVQADQGLYNYRPPQEIDATEYKWHFADVKPQTNSSNPLQFRLVDRPYPFCTNEIERHLKVHFKLGSSKAPVNDFTTNQAIVGPVNNFGPVAFVKYDVESTTTKPIWRTENILRPCWN